MKEKWCAGQKLSAHHFFCDFYGSKYGKRVCYTIYICYAIYIGIKKQIT